MTDELTKSAPSAVTTTFKWRTHDGQQLEPKDMVTRHLVYTSMTIF